MSGLERGFIYRAFCEEEQCRICSDFLPCPEGFRCAAKFIPGKVPGQAPKGITTPVGFCVPEANAGCINLDDCPGDPFCTGWYCGIEFRDKGDGTKELYSTCMKAEYDPNDWTCQKLDAEPGRHSGKDYWHCVLDICDGSDEANANPACQEGGEHDPNYVKPACERHEDTKNGLRTLDFEGDED